MDVRVSEGEQVETDREETWLGKERPGERRPAFESCCFVDLVGRKNLVKYGI